MGIWDEFDSWQDHFDRMRREMDEVRRQQERERFEMERKLNEEKRRQEQAWLQEELRRLEEKAAEKMDEREKWNKLFGFTKARVNPYDLLFVRCPVCACDLSFTGEGLFHCPWCDRLYKKEEV